MKGYLTLCGQREDNFLTIAKLWSVYKNVDFSAIDVAMMMALYYEYLKEDL